MSQVTISQTSLSESLHEAFTALFLNLDSKFTVDRILSFPAIEDYINNCDEVDYRARIFAIQWLRKHQKCCPQGISTREILGYIDAMRRAVLTLPN